MGGSTKVGYANDRDPDPSNMDGLDSGDGYKEDPSNLWTLEQRQTGQSMNQTPRNASRVANGHTAHNAIASEYPHARTP